MKISIVIPSRKRVARLMKAVETISSLAAHPEELEFVFRIDEDDSETIAAMTDFISRFNCLFIVGKHLGYNGSAKRLWEMSAMASGSWIWYFDDDAYLNDCSAGWDSKLSEVKGAMIVLPEINQLGGSLYPRNSVHPLMILPNKWWLCVGIEEFKLPTDFYFFSVLRKNGWETIYLPGVSTAHDRNKNDPLMIEQNRS